MKLRGSWLSTKRKPHISLLLRISLFFNLITTLVVVGFFLGRLQIGEKNQVFAQATPLTQQVQDRLAIKTDRSAVALINTTNGTVVGQYNGQDPAVGFRDLSFNCDGSRLIITDEASFQLLTINTETGAVVNTLQFSNIPRFHGFSCQQP